MCIFLVVGTRPQIIKSIPVIQEALKQGVDLKIVHTGQHYDYLLSKIFFEELSPPEPYVNLNVGSSSHALQTAEIMIGLEKLFLKEKPSVVLIPGDTNSALAGALVSVKLGINVGHIESGARSYDMKMAEEINRRLIDHCSKILFTPTTNCTNNLKNESVIGDIYQTGDTMYDVFIKSKIQVDKSTIIDKLDLNEKDYFILTTHRAENVDDSQKLAHLFEAFKDCTVPVIFPIHPRTKYNIDKSKVKLNNTNIHIIDPVGYYEMLSLLKNAKIVITDSGGLQKEAFWSKTPCITIRDRTEWVETVDCGVNFITDINPKKIRHTLKYIDANYSEIMKKFEFCPYGDGQASKRIVTILKENSID